MAVEKSFRQTEVGEIPSDWQLSLFKDVTNTLTCGVAATPTYVPEQYGKPFLSAQNVQNGKLDLRHYRFIDEKLYQRLTKHNKPEQGDVLYTRVGAGIGEAAVIDTNLDFAIYVSLTLIKTKRDKLHPYFLTQLLNSPRYRAMARGGQLAGAGVQNLNVNVVRSFSIPIPRMTEQEAIAEALSDADLLIESLEKLIAKKRLIKKGVMQELLTGKLRLPGFSGDWRSAQLADFAKFYKGKGLPKSQLAPSGKFSCIHYGELFSTYPETIISVYSRTNSDTDCFKSMPNDVLMPTSDVTPRGLAKASCVTLAGVILGGDILVIRPEGASLDGSFLSYQIRFQQQQILQLVTGTTVFHIYATDMKRFEFNMPSILEQRAVVNVLNELEREIKAIELLLEKTRFIKQGMMQELLTGRIRLI